MLKINSFAYCTDIQSTVAQHNSKQIEKLVNIIGEISLVNLPCQYTFALSGSVTGLDPSIKNEITLSFSSPTGDILEHIVSELPTHYETPQNTSLPMTGFNLNLKLPNCVFTEEGVYKTSICFKTGEKFEFPIDVVVIKS